ncbi:MAG: Cys-tRNA(Pro) deacylase [Oleiphilus sp.]|nr:MAG: Cys-tRNA(Pro) deacylase [Oleiphilus sp.]
MSTPAVGLLDSKKIPYRLLQYAHQPGADSYALEAVDKLGLQADMVFKTLMIRLDNHRNAIALLPAGRQLNMKKAAAAFKAKKAAMADPLDLQRSTGYVPGGVSPLAQKKKLDTVIDVSAQALSEIAVSGGRRGLELCLAPADLAQLTSACFIDICDDRG